MNSLYYLCLDDRRPNLEQLLSASTLSFDVEGTGVSMGKDYPVGFSLAYTSTGAFYRPIEDVEFKALLGDESKLKLAHNAKYDRSMLKKAGTIVDNLCDPMIAAHLLGKDRLALKELLYRYLGVEITAYEQLQHKITDMSMEDLAYYSCPHSFYLLALWPLLEVELKKLNLTHVFWDIEMPLVPVLSDMELDGVAVDRDALVSLGDYFDGKVALLTEVLDGLAGQSGINFNSPLQVSRLLYTKLGLTPDWKVGVDGRPSVRAEHLKKIVREHPIVGAYLQFKKYKTLKSNFVNGLLDKIIDGRVYGSFNQTRTRTGRLSSSDPNLQNIPQRTEEGRKIRMAFIAREGCTLLKSDYDLIELCMMAHCSQDPALLDAFRRGRDIHEETAIRAFGDARRRPDGKTLNFKLIYLGGTKAEQEMLFGIYPRVREWTRETNVRTREALSAKTINGRIRVIDEYVKAEEDRKYTGIMSMNQRLLEHGDREAISTIIQGSSAEIVKIGMRKTWEQLRNSGVKFPLQVHDEFVMEVPDNMLKEVIEVVKETMPYNELSIPITASISTGKSWGEMTKWDGQDGQRSQ